MKVGRMKKEEKTKQDKEKEDKTKKIRLGLKALKEMRKYQSSAEMLIRRLPFQRVVKEIIQKVWGDLRLQSTAILVLQRQGRCSWWVCCNSQISVHCMQRE